MTSTNNSVFRDMSREDLDAHYNNRVKVPTFEKYVADWGEATSAAHSQWAVQKSVPYGERSVDTLDVYQPTDNASGPRPCHVFFHGGYWFSLSKDNFGFVANGLCPHDWCTVVVDYELIPTTTMAGLIDQCRRALAWVYNNAQSLNVDPNRIQISGHSAGGHIVGMLMATDWAAQDASISQSPIQSACSLSGLFDLKPIALSYLNEILGLTDAEVDANSPVLLPCLTSAPLALLVGSLEGAEYERQSKDLQNKWASVLPGDGYQVMADHQHFSIVSAMNDPQSDVIAVLRSLR